jgi:hypothetical protein
VKNVHGEDVFRQKKHKRNDDKNEKGLEEIKENIFNTIASSNVSFNFDSSGT